MASLDLNLLKELDPSVEEITLNVGCRAWNENRILDGLLFIVKRSVEPRFQIVLKPARPLDTINSEFCRFKWVEDESDQNGNFDEEEEPTFLFPGQHRDFVIFFNNLEDSTRAINCIKRLVDNAATSGDPLDDHIELALDESQEILGPLQEEEQRGDVVASGTFPSLTEERLGPSGTDLHQSIQIRVEEEQGANGVDNTFDQNIYLQNSGVIMAMIAVLIATIVISVGLNPPSVINTFPLKLVFQITFWIAAVTSLASLLILGVVLPTSFTMQERLFRFAFLAISIALVCVLLAFAATTISLSTHLASILVGVFIGLIGIIIFSYFTSITVRDFLFSVTGFRLTQQMDNRPYLLTTVL